MTVQVFAEGASQGRLARELRNAFHAFVERAGVDRESLQFTACGSRGDAYNKFTDAIRKGAVALLLVDAEGPVNASDPWQHLQTVEGWHRPDRAASSQCHLMVQIMESWFLADPDTVECYYGRGFRRQVLPRNANVERVSKQDVLDGLDRAAHETPKRGYSKRRDSFKILENIDPMRVRTRSQYAERFLQALGA